MPLSEVEKTLNKQRLECESELFKKLDDFFADPDDSNLSALETSRTRHKKLLEQIGTARKSRLEFEKIQREADKILKSYEPKEESKESVINRMMRNLGWKVK